MLAALLPATAANAATPPLKQLTVGGTAYPISVASFGPQLLDVDATIAIAPANACDPLAGDYTGEILIVDRGVGAFSLKAEHAQAAHAAGAGDRLLEHQRRRHDSAAARRRGLRRSRSRWPA